MFMTSRLAWSIDGYGPNQYKCRLPTSFPLCNLQVPAVSLASDSRVPSFSSSPTQDWRKLFAWVVSQDWNG